PLRGPPLQLGPESPLERGPVLLPLRLGLRGGVVLGRAALARRLDPRRLALLLPVVRRPRRGALALGLVLPPQLAERRQRADRSIDPRAGIADLGEPRRDRGDRERLRLAGRHLIPRNGRGDPRVRQRPDRVRGGDGPVLRVLVVVEEDAVALLLPPLARRDVG